MKAAVLYKSGLVVEDNIEIPPLGDGQVLVKVAYSGICHSQLMEIRGFRGEDKYLPHLLGHEGSGIVVDIGKKVTKVKPDDPVILTWIKGEGIEAGGCKYRKGKTVINAGAVTTLNEYAVVSENRCVKLPKGVPLNVAVLFGCAIPTGAGIVFNEINPEEKSSIAIFGLGGIGLSALMAVESFDCSKVIAVDIEENKLKLAKEFGATHCINGNKKDPVKEIMQITEGAGVDYSVEAAGVVSSIEQAFESVRTKGGLCVFATHPKAGDKIKLEPHALISGKQIRGSWGGASCPDKDIPRFARLYTDGKLPLEKLLSHSYCLDDVNCAFDDLENRKVARAIINITE
ncbi:MAG: zinc-binding dehydrogenase [Sedimentisphaerales bacterium]|nr:zinc-binding dehydrogenase [Sedimentisphaerales bacterium]